MVERPPDDATESRLRDFLGAELQRAERDYVRPRMSGRVATPGRQWWFAVATLVVAVLIVAVLAPRGIGPIAGSGPGTGPTTAPPTGTPAACPAASIDGRLVGDGWGGLLLADDQGGVGRPVIWPAGWSVVADGDGWALLNAFGEVVAHVGDRVRLDGGETGTLGAWRLCGAMTLLPAP